MCGKGSGRQKIAFVAKHLPERCGNPVASAARFDAERAFQRDELFIFSTEKH